MASATIPVDLTNPGQVFACLGFMEATEILLGPCIGGFDWEPGAVVARFTLAVDGSEDPVATVLRFLARAEVKAVAPHRSKLSTEKWKVVTVTPAALALAAGGNAAAITATEEVFPAPVPETPAALPVILTDGVVIVPIEHWADDHASTGRDNVKFWAGAGGYPGAALARDALAPLAGIGDNVLAATAADPFALSWPQSSSFRFDWRRDYIPLDAGFSPNDHASMTMVGYPIVELLAAIGLQHARPDRPDRRDKLSYRYGVSSAMLPTPLARAVLGGQSLGFPIRIFSMRLGWPGQEGQARCIIDAQEEVLP